MAFRNGKTSCSLCATGSPAPTTGFPVEYTADCPVSTLLGDLVYVTGPAVLGVYQVATADPTTKTKMPAIGMVTAKATPTRCTVIALGEVIPPAALTAGKPAYVGLSGQPVSTKVTAAGPGTIAISQTIGYAVDTNKLLLNPGDFSTLSKRGS